MIALFSPTPDSGLPPGLQEAVERIDQRVTAGSRLMRRNPDGEQELTWRTVVAMLTLLAMAFAAGENWHRIDALTDVVEAQHEQNEKDHAGFANGALMEHQNTDMQRQLTSMSNKIDDLLVGQRTGRR